MNQFQENNWTNSTTKYWSIGTLFHRTIPATVRSLTCTTTVDWNLKVKYIECNVSLTKHCITVSIQKLSSIPKLTLMILQILGSHELNDHVIFDHAHPKIVEITFTFLNLHQHAKNQFTQSTISWDNVSFRVPWSDWHHSFFTLSTKKKSSTLSSCEFGSTRKKSGCFIICSWNMVD